MASEQQRTLAIQLDRLVQDRSRIEGEASKANGRGEDIQPYLDTISTYDIMIDSLRNTDMIMGDKNAELAQKEAELAQKDAEKDAEIQDLREQLQAAREPSISSSNPHWIRLQSLYNNIANIDQKQFLYFATAEADYQVNGADEYETLPGIKFRFTRDPEERQKYYDKAYAEAKRDKRKIPRCTKITKHIEVENALLTEPLLNELILSGARDGSSEHLLIFPESVSGMLTTSSPI